MSSNKIGTGSEKKQPISLENDLSSIRFKRKKAKSNMRIGGKVIAFLIIAGLAGALFSNIMMNIKYGDIQYQVKVIERSQNMRINDYSNIINKVSPSLVTVSCEEENLLKNEYFDGNTTGIVLDEKGNILISYESIKDPNKIYVKFTAKGTMPIKAKYIVGNEEMDLAIVQVEDPSRVKPIKIADANSIEEGQEIVILSNSVGDDYIGSILPGMITSRNEIGSFESGRHGMIKISAPINKENNGGAVCNSKGELIGIASEKISDAKNLKGIYYAINVNELKKIITSTNIFKNVLGLTGGGVIPQNNSEVHGFYVENVIKDGNAYNSGIKPTDIIFQIDEKSIRDSEDINTILRNKKSGDILKCKVRRNDKVKDIDIVLG